MIIRKQTTLSTNDDAKAIKSPIHGVAVVSDSQTQGRGRQCREFFSPSGGLYVSIVLTNLPKNLAVITPCVAVIIRDSIQRVTGKNCSLKWVNDLFLDGKKVAGILTESESQNGKITKVIVGVGINLFLGNCPEHLQSIITDLNIKDNDIKEKLLNTVVDAIANADFNNSDELLARYKKHCFMIGASVTVMANPPYIARAVDIDNNGGLVVEVDGKQKTISTGEISVKPLG